MLGFFGALVLAGAGAPIPEEMPTVLAGIWGPMFITAGIMRLPVIRFVIADGIAAGVGHSMLFFLAYWFGDSFKQLLERAEHTVDSLLRPLLILGAISAVGGYLLYHFLRHPVSTGDPDEVPQVLNKVATLLPHKDCPDPSDPECAEPSHALEKRRPTLLDRGQESGVSRQESESNRPPTDS